MKLSSGIDFPLILTILVLVSGLIALIDIIFFAPKRKRAGKKKKPILAEYSRSFFPVLLAVLLIRSFLIQPYRVPTGSLAPTILPGDFIAVNQFAYGLRLPVINYKILNIGEPRRGDIVLFHWPVKPSIIFVKRVVGLPGDHVIYKNKVLTINGKVASQTALGMALDVEPDDLAVPTRIKIENLLGVHHEIYVWPEGGLTKNFDIVVPQGEYFMMGDNRDRSDDSRDWGFVPEKNLVGKAFLIWMSWDSVNHKVRWHRIGNWVK